ncbi:hypothetical protein EDB85DRAFT_426568 [Lactarius pseudohatsudake]|nr:hypothetical protein EDB85DRAFT_426568 [Lactarius pseudohatsudake]
MPCEKIRTRICINDFRPRPRLRLHAYTLPILFSFPSPSTLSLGTTSYLSPATAGLGAVTLCAPQWRAQGCLSCTGSFEGRVHLSVRRRLAARRRRLCRRIFHRDQTAAFRLPQGHKLPDKLSLLVPPPPWSYHHFRLSQKAAQGLRRPSALPDRGCLARGPRPLTYQLLAGG